MAVGGHLRSKPEHLLRGTAQYCQGFYWEGQNVYIQLGQSSRMWTTHGLFLGSLSLLLFLKSEKKVWLAKTSHKFLLLTHFLLGLKWKQLSSVSFRHSLQLGWCARITPQSLCVRLSTDFLRMSDSVLAPWESPLLYKYTAWCSPAKFLQMARDGSACI